MFYLGCHVMFVATFGKLCLKRPHKGNYLLSHHTVVWGVFSLLSVFYRQHCVQSKPAGI